MINRFGPPQTPRAVRLLLWSLLAISLIATVVTQFFHFPLTAILALSPAGIFRGFFWQFVTYLFVVPGPLSFFFALYLLFELYIVWVIGTMLTEQKGAKWFVSLFLGGGIIAGACGLGISFLTTGMGLAGATCAIYALLVAWATLYPDMQMFLFLVMPVKGKWLVTGLIAIAVLFDLTAYNWPSLVANLVGAGLGFLWVKGSKR